MPRRKRPANVQGTRYQPFAERLGAAMQKGGLSAAEVARRIWGTVKDRRGYDVARNRDRIGHYLSGKSYPEPENLTKLAEAVGIPVDQLAMDMGDNPGRQQRAPARPHLTVTFEPSGKLRVRGQIDALIDKRRFQELIDLIDPEPQGAGEA